MSIKFGNVAVALLVTGCASTSVHRASATSYAARADNCEMLVLRAFPNDRKYEELATVQAKAGSTIFHSQDAEDLLSDMKARACELGADALVVVGGSDSNYWKLWANVRAKAEGVAIKLR